MIVVRVINRDNVRFERVFDNEWLAKLWIAKCKRGKSLVVVSVSKE